jgi:uncharacterized membrane protein (DUF106 family)
LHNIEENHGDSEIMPEWLISILVGGVIMGLIGVIYKNVLTKSEHAEVCKKNTMVIQENIKNTIKDELKDIKEYFDLKIENVVLKEIRKINGNKS